MFISIKGWMGKHNAVVTAFYKENLDYLKEVIQNVYVREYGERVPDYFNGIKTIKALKEFVKTEMDDMDNYPFGFKYIDGVYCLYQCVG